MGKHKQFQTDGLLKTFRIKRKCIDFPKMRKLNSHSTGKEWENTNIPKFWISEISRLKQKSIQFPDHVMNEFSYYEKSMRKHKHSKVMGFLNSSCEAEFPKYGKSELIPIIGEEYGETQTFQVRELLKYFA